MKVQGKYLKDEEGNVFSPVTNIKTIFNDTGINLLDLFYPVGTIYQTLNYDFNPNESWGGDWVRLLDGATLVDSGYNVETDSTIIGSSVGQIVGNKFHTLTIEEMPEHTHTFTGNSVTTSSAGRHDHEIYYNHMENSHVGLNHDNPNRTGVMLDHTFTDYVGAYLYAKYAGSHTHTVTPKGLNSNTGGGIKFELTPKSLVVCMWKRIN